MQTFLPYESFTESAKVLDNRRLNKQIVECKQILLANLCGPYQSRELTTSAWKSCTYEEFMSTPKINTRKTPWYNHPATKIWRSFENQLCYYAIFCCYEATNRGIKVTLKKFFENTYGIGHNFGYPPIIGYEPFHASHRSNLKRKDPVYYAAFTEPTNLPYIWTL
jgi:hypothetical protein